MIRTLMSILFALSILTGCVSNPSISDADNYLSIQSEIIKINSYRNRLLDSRKQLTSVISVLNVPNPTEPETRVKELAEYLADNDCLTATDFSYCYQVSRVRLIKLTRELDRTEYVHYLALLNINQLIGNINIILNTLGDEPSFVEAIKNNLPISEEVLKKVM